MARHADTVDGRADPAANLHHHDRQRDRDADPTVQDRIEKGILGVAVVAGVPPEAERLEEVLAQAVEGIRRAPAGEVVEPGTAAVDVETRVRVGRQTEGHDVETHLRGRRGDRGGEPSGCVHGH